jgi:hypothetical protein
MTQGNWLFLGYLLYGGAAAALAPVVLARKKTWSRRAETWLIVAVSGLASGALVLGINLGDPAAVAPLNEQMGLWAAAGVEWLVFFFFHAGGFLLFRLLREMPPAPAPKPTESLLDLFWDELSETQQNKMLEWMKKMGRDNLLAALKQLFARLKVDQRDDVQWFTSLSDAEQERVVTTAQQVASPDRTKAKLEVWTWVKRASADEIRDALLVVRKLREAHAAPPEFSQQREAFIARIKRARKGVLALTAKDVTTWPQAERELLLQWQQEAREYGKKASRH